MTNKQVTDYFERLAVSLVDLSHTEESKSFLPFDIFLLISQDWASRSDVKFPLMAFDVPEFSPNLIRGRASEEIHIAFTIIQKVVDTTRENLEQAEVITLSIARKIISRVAADLEDEFQSLSDDLTAEIFSVKLNDTLQGHRVELKISARPDHSYLLNEEDWK